MVIQTMDIKKLDNHPEPSTSKLNWVAIIARGAPHPVKFKDNYGHRDGKSYVDIEMRNFLISCVVEDDAPAFVIEELNRLSREA